MRSPAWLLLGVSSLPGELRGRGGRIAFTAHGTGSAWPFQLRRLERRLGTPGICDAIEARRSVRCFDWPLAEVAARFPWYEFGAGMRLQHGGQTLRFGFGRPGNMRIMQHNYIPLGGVRNMRAHWRSMTQGVSLGRLWREFLIEQRPE